MSAADTERVHQGDRRHPRVVMFLLLGVAIGTLVTLSILQSRVPTDASGAGGAAGSGEGPGASEPSMQGMSPTPAPDGQTSTMTADAVLRAHIPASFRAACKPGDREDAAGFSLTSLVCHPEGGIVTAVQYSWFHDAEAMRTRFAFDMRAAHVRGAADPSACAATGGNAFGRYWMNKTMTSDGRGAHHTSPHSPAGATHGRLLCYWGSKNTATLEWYDSDTHIYAWATTTQQLAAQMFRWWRAEAGPWHPPMDPSAM